jgi:hypothetical protein
MPRIYAKLMFNLHLMAILLICAVLVLCQFKIDSYNIGYVFFVLQHSSVKMGHAGRPWVADVNHPHYVAGRNAVKTGAL